MDEQQARELDASRGDFKREPALLAQTVVASAGAVPADGPFPRFVRFRFRRPLEYSVRWAGRYALAFSALNILVIAAGLASSAVAAAGDTNDTVIAVLGLVVALAGAVNRLWRPGLRGVVRTRTANALREEGWDFVCGRGEYAGKAEQARLDTFVDRVQKINRIAEEIDEQPVEGENEKAG